MKEKRIEVEFIIYEWDDHEEAQKSVVEALALGNKGFIYSYEFDLSPVVFYMLTKEQLSEEVVELLIKTEQETSAITDLPRFGGEVVLADVGITLVYTIDEEG